MGMQIDSTLRLQNDSRPEGQGWWEWSVWVEGEPQELALLESVTYRLHPTFPNPVREVVDATGGFRLSGAGWGEFTIVADARFKDGRVARLERWLKLQEESGEHGAVESGPGRRQPTVYVSHSVTDNSVVHALSEALARQGVRVLTDQDLDSEGECADEVRELLRSADAVLPIVSDPPSDFVEAEAKLARDAGRPVLPILVGGAKPPPSLARLARLELREEKNIERLANGIAARVKRREC